MSTLVRCPDCGGIVATRFSVHVCKHIAPKHKSIDSFKQQIVDEILRPGKSRPKKRRSKKSKPCQLCGGFHK